MTEEERTAARQEVEDYKLAAELSNVREYKAFDIEEKAANVQKVIDANITKIVKEVLRGAKKEFLAGAAKEVVGWISANMEETKDKKLAQKKDEVNVYGRRGMLLIFLLGATVCRLLHVLATLI